LADLVGGVEDTHFAIPARLVDDESVANPGYGANKNSTEDGGQAKLEEYAQFTGRVLGAPWNAMAPPGPAECHQIEDHGDRLARYEPPQCSRDTEKMGP